MEREGYTAKEMDSQLNKKSGLLGITGQYTDRRDIGEGIEAGDERCKLAFDIESYRIKKYIGAYMAALGRVDAIVFTAGVGEMGAEIRQAALEGLEPLGVKVDKEKNLKTRTKKAEVEISTPDSPVKVFVIPTDEELVFTEDVVGILENTYSDHMSFDYTFKSKDYERK
jgi:acetate kinase